MTHPKPATKPKKQIVTLKVPVDRLAKWKRYAKRHGVSLSAAIRFAVDKQIDA